MPSFGDIVSNALSEANSKGRARDEADLFLWLLKAASDDAKVIPLNPLPWLISDSIDSIQKIKAGNADKAVQKYLDVLEIAKGQAAKVQLQNVIGQVIPEDATITKNLFDAMGFMASLSANLSAVGITAEVLTLGQVDRITSEIRSYVDATGANQLTAYGYGLILERVLGDPISQELNSLMQHALIGMPELITTQTRRDTFNPDSPSWDADLLVEVRKYGLSEKRADAVLKAYNFYPNPQDWIRFAVRDVFNAAAVADGGYDEDFPEDILKHSRKAGVRDENMRQYWRAHWQLPSPNMLYEMLHRGIITEEQAIRALKTDDWAPKWIPRLIEMAYQPLTRVDARRMFDSGVLDEPGYLRAMQDIGYSPESAKMFVDWATTEKKAAQRDLTVSQVQSAYDLGLVTESEYREQITKHGYDEKEAEILAGLGAAKRSHALADVKAKLAIKKFTYGVIDEAALKVELDQAGLTKEAADIEAEKAKVSKTSRRKLPSKEDVLRWVKKGMITESEASERLSVLGYNEDDRTLYLSEALGE